MRLTFQLYSIILGLAAVFMIAGLYAWIFLGAAVDQGHRASEHDNITKILSHSVDIVNNITTQNSNLLKELIHSENLTKAAIINHIVNQTIHNYTKR